MESRLKAGMGGHPMSQKKKTRWAKKAAATAVATTMLAGSVIGVATVATAADAPGTHWHGANYVVAPQGANGDWNSWLGSMHDPNSGEYAWCTDWGVDAGLTPSSPEMISDGNTALFNYIVQTKQRDTSPANHTAISVAGHKLLDPRYAAVWNGNGPAFGTLATAPSLANARASADQMIAEAQANSGPYRIQPQLVIAPGGKRGTVAGTSVLSASGNPINGWAGTATLSGPAVWAGTNSQAVNLHAGDVLPEFISTGNGRVTVNIDITGAPASSLRKHKIPGEQGMVVTSGTTTVSGQSGDVLMTFDFQPVATSTAVSYVEAGDKLADALHVNTSTGSANDWAFVDGANVPAIFDVDWYYSPTKLAPSAEVPASAKLFTSGQGTATDVGDITVSGTKVADQAGYYYPVAKFTKASQPENLRQYFTADWKAGFNDPNEQTIQKYQPKFHTVSSQIVDGKIHDVIEVTDNNPEAELSIDSTLYLTATGPVDGGVDAAPADSITIGKVTTKVKGNGTFTTPALDIPWDKVVEMWGTHSKVYVTWAETATATESTKPVTPRPLQPTETIELTKPTIVTKASENGTVPLDMNDTGVISGTIPSGPSVKVETSVKQYKFDNSTDGSAQAVCLNASYESPSQEVTSTTTTVIYPSHRVEHEGTYGYVETLNVGVTVGDKTTTTVLHEGKCGEKSETVIGFKPNVPVSFEKPVLPIVQAGDVVATTGPNTALYIGGGALALAGITIASIMVIRRKVAAETLADSK